MRGRGRPAASLPDAARAIARGLSAGLPLADAFARGSEAVDPCTASVLRDCAAALDAGDATTTALAPLRAHRGGAVLAGAIELHQELGGDLVTALLGLAEGLADRERLRLEARALTTQARFAARIVPLAPLGAFAMLAVLAPSSAGALLGEPVGLALLGIAASLTLLALVLLRRIARGAGL